MNGRLLRRAALRFTLLLSSSSSLLSENGALETIGPGAFSDLPELVEL